MKRMNIFQRLTMPLPELEAYYRQRRKEHWENKDPFKDVKLRRILHPVLITGARLSHILSNQKVTILANRQIKTDKPVIYAATHIGWDDIEMIISTIDRHAYLFWGDPRGTYRTIDGFLLDINGCIICDTDDKLDRFVGKETCIKWIQQGGNLLIFPEGAWNITENLPVMQFFTGTAEMSIRTGADIVPIAIEQYGKDYTINIGKNISPAGFTVSDKREFTDMLRDAIATLKWQIWESHPISSRASLPAETKKLHTQKLMTENKEDSYSLEYIDIIRFHTKEELEQKAVECHLDKLIPNRKNAFLFRK